MKNTLVYREMQRADADALEQIIRNTWNYDRFCTPKVAARMAKLYLASCLCHQTYTCVAVQNGVPVGVIMGNNKKSGHRRLRYVCRQAVAILGMLISREGRQIFRFFAGIDTLDQSLLTQSGTDFDGELAFFAVRSNQRGTGIGKTLFENLLTYMRAQQIKQFYLYTDSTCNFGFYEHQGMERIAEKSLCLGPKQDEVVQFFLYAYQMPHEEPAAQLA